jgi:propionyl-CoA carboxylase alpha chain
MGDKIESKKLAMDTKVNTIPGQLGLINTETDAIRVSKEIVYPVMINASTGGGGKGMRVAYNDAEAGEGCLSFRHREVRGPAAAHRDPNHCRHALQRHLTP